MSEDKQQKRNIPELRFPEFSGEWEEKKLGDLGEYLKSYPFSRAKEGKGKYKHIHYGDIHTKLSGKIDSSESLPSIMQGSEFTVVEKGDIVFADASEDYADLGKAVMINFSDDNVIAGLHTHLFRPIKYLAPDFLVYSTNTEKYRKHITKEGNGISVLGISKTNLSKFKVLLPSFKEQQKIGDFFSKLDRLIELEEKKLALLEEQKKGYMQKIFSQELRFKDDNGNEYPKWSIKKIEDISKVNKGFTPNTKNDEYWNGEEQNWLSIAGMTEKYLYKGNKGITEKGALKHAKVEKNTLIMSFKLTLGKLAIVKKPIYTNEAICHFEWKNNNIDTEYMYYYLTSINIKTFGAQ
ncbi:restriction endonuclease subunit S, partial [Staphylococcus condimenti]